MPTIDDIAARATEADGAAPWDESVSMALAEGRAQVVSKDGVVAVVVDDEVAEQLEVTDASQVLVLLMLTAGVSLERTTANLLAPILVNIRTRRAVQVVLDSPTYPVAAPLVA